MQWLGANYQAAFQICLWKKLNRFWFEKFKHFNLVLDKESYLIAFFSSRKNVIGWCKSQINKAGELKHIYRIWKCSSCVILEVCSPDLSWKRKHLLFNQMCMLQMCTLQRSVIKTKVIWEYSKSIPNCYVWLEIKINLSLRFVSQNGNYFWLKLTLIPERITTLSKISERCKS